MSSYPWWRGSCFWRISSRLKDDQNRSFWFSQLNKIKWLVWMLLQWRRVERREASKRWHSYLSWVIDYWHVCLCLKGKQMKEDSSKRYLFFHTYPVPVFSIILNVAQRLRDYTTQRHRQEHLFSIGKKKFSVELPVSLKLLSPKADKPELCLIIKEKEKKRGAEISGKTLRHNSSNSSCYNTSIFWWDLLAAQGISKGL